MKIENTPPYLQDIFGEINSGELIAKLIEFRISRKMYEGGYGEKLEKGEIPKIIRRLNIELELIENNSILNSTPEKEN